MTEPNDVQLALIEQIGSLLDQSAIRFWLRGGWALDFHLGRLTRHHADIDPQAHSPKAERLFGA